MPAEAKRYTSCCGLEYQIQNDTQREDDQHPSSAPLAKDESPTKSELLVQEALQDLLTSILAQQEKQIKALEFSSTMYNVLEKVLETISLIFLTASPSHQSASHGCSCNPSSSFDRKFPDCSNIIGRQRRRTDFLLSPFAPLYFQSKASTPRSSSLFSLRHNVSLLGRSLRSKLVQSPRGKK